MYEIKSKFDSYYYDFLTYYAPPKTADSKLLVVEVSDDEIKDAKSTLGKNHWSYLKELVENIQVQSPKVVFVFLPSQDYLYESDSFTKFCQLVRSFSFVYIGVYDQSWLDKFYLEDKKNTCRVFDASTHRVFKREVLRNIYLSSLENEKPSIIYQGISDYIRQEKGVDAYQIWNQELEEKVIHNFSQYKSVLINYSSIKSISKIDSSKVLQKLNKISFKDKIVFIGSKSYRKRTIHHREGTFVNTPWQSDENNEFFGVPLLSVYPVMAANLLNNSSIFLSSRVSNIFIQFILFFLAFLVWFYSRIIGFVYCFLQLLIIFSASLFCFHNYYLLFDGFTLLGMSFMGSFLGSFAVEKKQINVKISTKKNLASKILVSNYDNKIFLGILKEIDYFIYKSKVLLAQIICDESNSFEDKMKKEIQKKISTLSSNVEGLYHYVLALEKKILDMELVPLLPLVDDLLKTFDDQIRHKKIKIDLRVDEMIHLRTDKILFQAIIYNVLFNAIKYTYLQTVIEIKCFKKNKYYVFSISDQGPGFDFYEKKKNLFETSENIKHQYSSLSKGYGLGLYLSYLIARKINLSFSLGRNKTYKSIFKIIIKDVKK